MDPELARLIAADTPKFNPQIANGFARELLKVNTRYTPITSAVSSKEQGTLEYVDRLFRATNPSFPTGLVYHHCQRCTPQEQFDFITRENHRTKRREFDMAQADVVLVKFFFTLHGKPIPTWHMFLPFVTDASVMHLGGARFTITPVINDPVISATYSRATASSKKAKKKKHTSSLLLKERVFVRMLGAKLNFLRDLYPVLINGQRENVRIAYARVYNPPKGKNKGKFKPRGYTTLAHYLFGKYGFESTMLKFTGCIPVVGTRNIDTDAYPADQWTIFSSTQTPPHGVKRGGYVPTQIRVALRNKDVTRLTETMIASFFYVVDHFPDRMEADPGYYNSTLQWQVLLGRLLFSQERGDILIQQTMRRHYAWLDEYLDAFTRENLHRIGLDKITNIFELFVYIADNFGALTTLSKKEPSSLYDKELEVYYYVFKDLIYGLHHMCYALRRDEKRELRPDGVTRAFWRHLRAGLLFNLRSGHSEVQSFNYSGDNKAINITTRSVLQERYTKPKIEGDGEQPYRRPSAPLHQSQAEVNEYGKLSRSNADGRAHLNPMLQVDAAGRVLRNPAMTPVVDKAGNVINFKLHR